MKSCKPNTHRITIATPLTNLTRDVEAQAQQPRVEVYKVAGEPHKALVIVVSGPVQGA
jgi:hypothetical protein